MPLAIGAVLENRYRIEALLGEGGMGAVYRARDLRIRQDVAIKENRMASPASARQFEREAVVMAGLRHPNLPRLTDHFVTPDGAQYLVMDYIEGQDLGQILAHSGPLDEARALAWIERVCDALAYLHGQQPPVIHRDIKPSNIKITPRGEVYLVDFGIAKVGDARARTSTGALGVTAGFSPLEQYGSGGTDARSDIYALGATLYALLTGKTPPDSVEIATHSAALTPVRRVCPTLSPHVALALEAALQTSPTDRPQTVAEFRSLLTAEDRPVAPTTADAATTLMDEVAPAEGSHSASKPERGGARTTAEGLKAVPVWVWALGGVALVALAIGLGAVIGGGAGRETPTPRPATEAPTEAPEEPTEAPTEEPTEEPVPSGPGLGDTWTRPADGMVMVYVPAGEFEMGSNDGDSDEQPVHTVALDAFWMDRTEVTNDQYRDCVEAGECEAPLTCSWGEPTYEDASKADHPVVCVDWHGAAAYCEWAGGRLPTEAEWEYAARGTSGSRYPWGDAAPRCDLANCWGQDGGCVGETAPVGSYVDGASWCGALDLAGNVWEWAADWYDAEYYGVSPSRNPRGPSSGEFRVVRGGSWNDGPDNARSAGRCRYDPGDPFDGLGFRCARGS